MTVTDNCHPDFTYYLPGYCQMLQVHKILPQIYLNQSKLRYWKLQGSDAKMAEQESKTELSKEAQVAGVVREDLVSTAVKFLQNPKVTQSPLSQKKAFLQRKGLTDEEIDIAVKRAGLADSVPPALPATQTSGQHLAMSPAVPQKIQDPVYSKWMRARDMIAVVSVVTGMSYAAYRLYKELIRPFLFGIPSTEERLATLEKTMAESVEKISQTLSGIELVLGKQQEKLQMISHDVNSKTTNYGMSSGQKETSLGELKSEIASLKGLLLNRRQFPPVPTSVPSLPAWQLTNEAGDNSNSKGKEEDMTGSQTPEISFSPLPSQVSIAGVSTTDIELSDAEKLSIQANGIQTGTDVSAKENTELIKTKTDDNSEVDNVSHEALVTGERSSNSAQEKTDKVVVDKVETDIDGDSTESLD